MRDNSYDRTIERNYVQKWRFLIKEYEEGKAGRSTAFESVGAFYRHHGTCSQTFRKYYNRHIQMGGEDAALMPQRRGPKWKGRRLPEEVVALALAERRRGLNRYEICALLRERQVPVPSPSTIYRLCRDHGLNRRTEKMIQAKRRIIKDRLGELGHVDLHQLPRDLFLSPPAETCYIVSLVDSCSRLAWAEVVAGKKALPVMFKTLKMLNTLNVRYGLVFANLLTDNGAEFAARNHPADHPFEAMLLELGIRHRYTRPYRPQTNGKVERFWRTLDDDLLDGTTFDNLDQLINELLEYIIYYNEFRPHQAINGLTPKAFALTKSDQPPSANL
jgi:transposase InsO family protein